MPNPFTTPVSASMKSLSQKTLPPYTYAGLRGLGIALILACLPLTAVAQDNTESQPPETYVRTESGLQYADVKVGTGPAARPGSRVIVHYTGWLKSRYTGVGKKFDSSRDSNEPFQFILGTGGVIAGWDEGVQGMQVGGVRKLIVPPTLGYGARGAGASIPPNATLIFDIEMLRVN
jgi:FKBP-type peptidyl-prolyl cis-trans isomerase FkpA